jgi:hypothetical protein
VDWQKHVPQLSGDLCEIKADDPVWLDIDLMINEQNLVKVISGMCPSSNCQSSISSLNITCSRTCHSEMGEASLNIAGYSSISLPSITVFTTSTFSNPSPA